jgi:hypothetical protein
MTRSTQFVGSVAYEVEKQDHQDGKTADAVEHRQVPIQVEGARCGRSSRI